MPEGISKTFHTDREALAFMMGFHAAASDQVFVNIDPEEPFTILADFGDDDAEGIWRKAAQEFNEAAPAPADDKLFKNVASILSEMTERYRHLEELYFGAPPKDANGTIQRAEAAISECRSQNILI